MVDKIPCLRHFCTVRIRPDGGVQPCCFHPPLSMMANYQSENGLKVVTPGSSAVMRAYNAPAWQSARRRIFEHGYICEDVCSGPMKYFDKVRARNANDIKRRGRPNGAYAENEALLLSDIAEGRTTVRAVPPFWTVVSTLKCNLKCVKCFQRPQREAGVVVGYDPKPVLDFILDNHDKITEATVQGGEIFMDPITVEFLKRSAEIGAGYGVGITTNGTLLHKHWPVLEALNCALTVSIDSFDRETYKALHGRDECVRVLGNMACARSMVRRGALVDLSIKVVVQAGNIEELPTMARWAKERGIHISYVPAMLPGDHPEIGLDTVDRDTALAAIDETLKVQPPDHGAERLKVMRKSLTKGAG